MKDDLILIIYLKSDITIRYSYDKAHVTIIDNMLYVVSDDKSSAMFDKTIFACPVDNLDYYTYVHREE